MLKNIALLCLLFMGAWSSWTFWPQTDVQLVEDIEIKSEFRTPEYQSVYQKNLERQRLANAESKQKNPLTIRTPADSISRNQNSKSFDNPISPQLAATFKLAPHEKEVALRGLLESNPTDVNVIYLLAMLLQFEKQQEAEELAIECLSLDPFMSSCHGILVGLHSKGGHDEVMPYIQDCLDISPLDPYCNYQLSNVYTFDDNLDEAEFVTERLEQADPDNLFTYLAKANLARAKKDIPEAIKYFQLACNEQNPWTCEEAEKLKSKM